MTKAIKGSSNFHPERVGVPGRAPGYLMNKFTRISEVHDRNTRYNKDLNLPRCRLKTA